MTTIRIRRACAGRTVVAADRSRRQAICLDLPDSVPDSIAGEMVGDLRRAAEQMTWAEVRDGLRWTALIGVFWRTMTPSEIETEIALLDRESVC